MAVSAARRRLGAALLAPFALAACQQGGGPASTPPFQDVPAPDKAEYTTAPPQEAVQPLPQRSSGFPLAAELTRLEWSKAENRAHCRPIALTSSGGAAVSARRADFYGGWAVAFDLPGMRSAYGVAGVGMLPSDNDPIGAKEQALRTQWPYFRALPGLGQPAFAGYGVEGGGAYPADNPGGTQMDSLAYVQVDGQKCRYNVWSKLGRKHLETLLDSLRPL